MVRIKKSWLNDEISGLEAVRSVLEKRNIYIMLDLSSVVLDGQGGRVGE